MNTRKVYKLVKFLVKSATTEGFTMYPPMKNYPRDIYACGSGRNHLYPMLYPAKKLYPENLLLLFRVRFCQR